MREMGQRIQDIRITMNLTQAQMADRSGVALRTVVRIENGESVKVESVLNILRVLGMLENLNNLIQEQVLASAEIVDIGKKRKRVTTAKKKQGYTGRYKDIEKVKIMKAQKDKRG